VENGPLKQDVIKMQAACFQKGTLL